MRVGDRWEVAASFTLEPNAEEAMPRLRAIIQTANQDSESESLLPFKTTADLEMAGGAMVVVVCEEPH